MSLDELKGKYDEAKRTLALLEEEQAEARRIRDFKKAREAYTKYSLDKSFKIISKNSDHLEGWYWARFEGPEEDRPREVRRKVVYVCVNEKRSAYTRCTVSKSYNREQKFFCVNGPLAGQWALDKQADYQVFNRAARISRSKGVPTAVLVHLPSIKEPK